MAKCMLKEFKKVSEVSNTLPNARIWSFPKTTILCFASCSSVSYSSILPGGGGGGGGVVAAFWLSFLAFVSAPVS